MFIQFVSREFVACNLDPIRRHDLWRLIQVYLDSTQDFFELGTDIFLSCHLLLSRFKIKFHILLSSLD